MLLIYEIKYTKILIICKLQFAKLWCKMNSIYKYTYKCNWVFWTKKYKHGLQMHLKISHNWKTNIYIRFNCITHFKTRKLLKTLQIYPSRVICIMHLYRFVNWEYHLRMIHFNSPLLCSLMICLILSNTSIHNQTLQLRVVKGDLKSYHTYHIVHALYHKILKIRQRSHTLLNL